MYHYTCESVSEGHPDKVCDQISDAILDAYLAADPDARVAVECLITPQKLIIAGEVTSSASVDVVFVARKVLKQIGYTEELIGTDSFLSHIENLIRQESRKMGERRDHVKCGEQGIVYGYATSESWYYIPKPLMLAHLMMEKQAELRKNGTLPWLRPNAKAQVTMYYNNDWPEHPIDIMFCSQHNPKVDLKTIENEIIRFIIHPILAKYALHGFKPRIRINPEESVTQGLSRAGIGLTGRKIMVDTYGGIHPHGGGAFSGKDPNNAERSGAYMARYISRHIIEANLAERCSVQINYSNDVTHPLFFDLTTYKTGVIKDSELRIKISNLFDMTPAGIIRTLNLKQPIYQPTATYGHFGRTIFPWEQIVPVITEKLASAVNQ